MSQPDPAIYRRELEVVRSALAASAKQTAVRGNGLAQFAWAESGDRSVCLSWCAQGVFLELWEGNQEAEEAVHPCYEAAVQLAAAWLRRESADGAEPNGMLPKTGS